MDTGEEILDANSVTNYKSDSIYSMIAFFFFIIETLSCFVTFEMIFMFLIVNIIFII